ncbi:MAG: energy transducer TonB [Allosphingosinicella sp.]|uniref:energy transducer TonB n=1 Tax=Allosphingosinicella sp. TaxID=2823234 RepID=UPI003931058C
MTRNPALPPALSRSPEGSGSFLDQKPRSPGSLMIVILLHGAAIGALLLAKGPIIVSDPWVRTEVEFIKEPPPPPPTEPEARPEPPESVIARVERIVPTPPIERPPVIDQVPQAQPPIFDPRVGQTAEPPRIEPTPLPPMPVPSPSPVRVEADVDPRYAAQLQPPYPASEERAGNEGTVAIRVTIGTDGRVKDAERVRASSETFWRATERHARANWRFKPATVDGRPVESRKTMTVHFRLTN